tara:strand:+ start:341 stop:1009 length:669 start_codon:yes stop_codon:yes gene_type:complete
MGYVNVILNKYKYKFYTYYKNFDFQNTKKNKFNIWTYLEQSEKDRLENLFETRIIKDWPEKDRVAFENSRILPIENYLKEKGYTADSSIGINLEDSYSTSDFKDNYNSQHILTEEALAKLQEDLIVLTDKLIHIELHKVYKKLYGEFQSHFMSWEEKNQFIENENKKKKDEENRRLKKKKRVSINNFIPLGVEHLKTIKNAKKEYEDSKHAWRESNPQPSDP